jgi:hypothetical protein
MVFVFPVYAIQPEQIFITSAIFRLVFFQAGNSGFPARLGGVSPFSRFFMLGQGG